MWNNRYLGERWGGQMGKVAGEEIGDGDEVPGAAVAASAGLRSLPCSARFMASTRPACFQASKPQSCRLGGWCPFAQRRLKGSSGQRLAQLSQH